MATLSLIPTQDVYISEYFANQNFYGNSSLYCGQFHSKGDIYRSLLKFDINSVPVSSTITAAKLKLFLYRNDTPTVSRQINVFRILNNFSEFSVTYDNQPQAIQNPDANLSVINELNTYVVFNVGDLVNGWYNGSIPNNGIMLAGLETANTLVGFYSKKFSDSSYWPLLEVDYVKGITYNYPVENIETGPNWAGSTPIPLESRIVTFGVMNTGSENSADITLQVSPDGVTWFVVPYSIYLSPLIFSPGDTFTFTTSGYSTAYARIAYINNSGNTTLSIYPTAVEV